MKGILSLSVFILSVACTIASFQEPSVAGPDAAQLDETELFDPNRVNDDDLEGVNVSDLLLLPSGRPICYDPRNWRGKFRHNWYVRKYWTCNFVQAELHECSIPRLFQPSLEQCVLPWDWVYEPLFPRDPTTTTTQAPVTTTTTEEVTTTTENPSTHPPPSRCDAPRCYGIYSAFLQPTHNPRFFYQCAPFGPVRMPCAPGTVFSYTRQSCVWPRQWKNYC